MLDGGSIMSLVQVNAAILIFGGTLGATMTSVSLNQFVGMFKYLRIALFGKSEDPLLAIETLVELASVARREGILALEEQMTGFSDPFLQSGIQLVVDGVDPELVKSMLETEIMFIEERHESAAGVFETAGGYAPTMGIIGTVMGLVHVLGNLKDVNALGPQIATAFTATLYGVASANIFWLPIGNKLKKRNKAEMLLREIMVEGILSIQAGENPKILDQKLKTFLAPSARKASSKNPEMREANFETV